MVKQKPKTIEILKSKHEEKEERKATISTYI